MKQVDVVLPLFAALWASGTLFNAASKERNDKRDRILSRYLEGRRMSREHRLLLLRSDWLPLSLVLIILAVTLSVVASCVPLLIPEEERSPAIWVVAGAVASYSITCSAAWAWTGAREYKMMMRYIDKDLSSVEG